jgi:hypothetical protein
VLCVVRGELSYLTPLGSEKISAPYFKQCSFCGGRGGGISNLLSKSVGYTSLKEGSSPPLCQNTWSLCGGGPIVPACEDATRVKRRLLFDRVGVFMADIIFTLLSLLLCFLTKEN